jgi:hypothetical protein
VPILETVIGKVASNVAASVATRAGERVLGSPEQRAFENACRGAIREATDSLVKEKHLGRDETVHLLQLLDMVVTSRGSEGVDWVDSGDGSLLADWIGTARLQGLDPSTLPELSNLIERVRAAIPIFLREHGKHDKSALFNRVTLEALDELVQESRSLQEHMTHVVSAAKLVPMAPYVQAALDAVLTQCRAKHVPFVTPHVLVALLDIEGGRVQPCLDSLDGEQSRAMVTRLRNYVRRNDARRQPFRAFSWYERDDIRRAQQIAARYDLRAVDDLCLFVAILEGRSQTVASLGKLLGPERFQSLRVIAERSLGSQEYGRTEGEVFGTEG